MNLQTRIEKLEQRITEDVNVSDVNLEFYDVNGQKVDAKILRMPMDWECGLAISVPSGTEIEIACEGNWSDIIFKSEHLLNSEIVDKTRQEKQEDCLFLRKNGQIGAVEMIYHKQIGK